MKLQNKAISISNIVKNYFRVLEVISTLKIDFEDASRIGRKAKMSYIEIVDLGLTAEYMSIDSENDLFKRLENTNIPNLIERSQFNKR